MAAATACPNCSFGIAPNGEYCQCSNGQSRKALDERRKQEMTVRDELRKEHAIANAKARVESIPLKMRPFSFDSYLLAIKRRYSDGDDSKKDALDACKAYAKTFHLEQQGQPIYNLLMIGNVGTGKTGLSIPILKAGIAVGMRVAYIDFTVFMSECHQSDLDTKEASILNLSKLDILVIDDLGTAERKTGEKLRSESADSIRVATQIINYRIQRFLPTIITSNLSIDGLNEQFGQRLASRIIESCAVLWVGGRDMRLDGQAPTVPNRIRL